MYGSGLPGLVYLNRMNHLRHLDLALLVAAAFTATHATPPAAGSGAAALPVSKPPVPRCPSGVTLKDFLPEFDGTYMSEYGMFIRNSAPWPVPRTSLANPRLGLYSLNRARRRFQ